MKTFQLVIASLIIINCLSVLLFLTIAKRGNLLANRIFALLLLAICFKISFAFLISIPHTWLVPSLLLYYASEAAYFSIGPLLLLYYKALYRDSTPTYWLVLFFVPATTPFIGHFFKYDIPLELLQLIMGVFLITIFFYLKKTLSANENKLKVYDIYWIKALFVSFSIIWLVVFLLFIDFDKYFLELLITLVAVFYVNIYLVIKHYWLQQGDSNEASKYKNSNLSVDEENNILARLQTLMAQKKVYLDAEISLPKVASQIGVSPHKLSQVINQRLDMTFNEFINSNRINDIKNAILQPQYQNAKIASLAFDYGFNTISAFNIAFKKYTNYTPSQYRSTYAVSNQN